MSPVPKIPPIDWDAPQNYFGFSSLKRRIFHSFLSPALRYIRDNHAPSFGDGIRLGKDWMHINQTITGKSPLITPAVRRIGLSEAIYKHLMIMQYVSRYEAAERDIHMVDDWSAEGSAELKEKLERNVDLIGEYMEKLEEHQKEMEAEWNEN
tara:strand:+ start:1530 stop:1985 length:456 start_codon:yes stop_codon:yes gene_type:complete